MKIGFDDIPATPAGTYSQHLARLMAEYAPEHEYIADTKRYREFDLYHGFRPGVPLPVLLRKTPCVVTVHNLNFLRYPHLYTLPERMVLLRLYRHALRAASRLITVNRDAREELSERLRIDPGRIEVVMPLAARVPQEPPADAALEAVRRKYMLPREFVLMLGTVEPRHNHEVVFEAFDSLGARDMPAAGRPGVVVCGRRTTYSDFLMGFARERHMASRVDFIYELTPDDLPALFRMARAFVYLPDADIEASIVPVVEALRARVPMVLSDTQLNREAAGDAAVYVRPEAVGEVAAALENVLFDGDFRREMQSRERRRAELFSEYAVARRLIDIYSSL